jgi:hypothetical protein
VRNHLLTRHVEEVLAAVRIARVAVESDGLAAQSAHRWLVVLLSAQVVEAKLVTLAYRLRGYVGQLARPHGELDDARIA